jgi:ATP synthase protein I
MSDDPTLDDLKKKIAEAKGSLKPSSSHTSSSLTNKYFNVGVELVSGVLAGVGVGLFIDWYFNSSPWGLISLFILGSSAGILNVFRTLTQSENKEDKNG